MQLLDKALVYAWHGSGRRWDTGWPQLAGCGIGGFAIWFWGLKVPPEILDNPPLGAILAIIIGALAGGAAVFLLRLCWWPIHKRLEPLGGLAGALRLRLGVNMLPVILMSAGVAAFIVLFSAGMILFALQAGRQSHAARPGNAASPSIRPEISLLPPKDRYELRWDPTKGMNFQIAARLDDAARPSRSQPGATERRTPWTSRPWSAIEKREPGATGRVLSHHNKHKPTA